MGKEHLQPPEPFAFTEQEKLWERLSHSRLTALLNDEQTTIHKAEVAANTYGEFLFLAVSYAEEGEHLLLTFFGQGYHEYRERWYTNEWAWYQAAPFPQTLEQRLTREATEEVLQARQEEIAPYVAQATQTGKGKLFELLADMTDDDGAIADLEEMEDWFDSLNDV